MQIISQFLRKQHKCLNQFNGLGLVKYKLKTTLFFENSTRKFVEYSDGSKNHYELGEPIPHTSKTCIHFTKAKLLYFSEENQISWTGEFPRIQAEIKDFGMRSAILIVIDLEVFDRCSATIFLLLPPKENLSGSGETIIKKFDVKCNTTIFSLLPLENTNFCY